MPGCDSTPDNEPNYVSFPKLCGETDILPDANIIEVSHVKRKGVIKHIWYAQI